MISGNVAVSHAGMRVLLFVMRLERQGYGMEGGLQGGKRCETIDAFDYTNIVVLLVNMAGKQWSAH
jgi:hypothetical protein